MKNNQVVIIFENLKEGKEDCNIQGICDRLFNLTLIYHQFCPDLALIYHTPPRSYAGFSDFYSKKVKKVCDNNLTHAGYGALCVENSLSG